MLRSMIMALWAFLLPGSGPGVLLDEPDAAEPDAAEPTVEETIKWIASKISGPLRYTRETGDGDSTTEYEGYKVSQVDKCVVEVRWQKIKYMFINDPDYTDQINRQLIVHRLDLSKADGTVITQSTVFGDRGPSPVQLGEAQVYARVPFKEGNRFDDWDGRKFEDGLTAIDDPVAWDKTSTNARFFFPSMELAGRAKTALEHALKVCGGLHVEKPAPKEPFAAH